MVIHTVSTSAVKLDMKVQYGGNIVPPAGEGGGVAELVVHV